jgi:hypothetical protein
VGAGVGAGGGAGAGGGGGAVGGGGGGGGAGGVAATFLWQPAAATASAKQTASVETSRRTRIIVYSSGAQLTENVFGLSMKRRQRTTE